MNENYHDIDGSNGGAYIRNLYEFDDVPFRVDNRSNIDDNVDNSNDDDTIFSKIGSNALEFIWHRWKQRRHSSQGSVHYKRTVRDGKETDDYKEIIVTANGRVQVKIIDNDTYGILSMPMFTVVIMGRELQSLLPTFTAVVMGRELRS